MRPLFFRREWEGGDSCAGRLARGGADEALGEVAAVGGVGEGAQRAEGLGEEFGDACVAFEEVGLEGPCGVEAALPPEFQRESAFGFWEGHVFAIPGDVRRHVRPFEDPGEGHGTNEFPNARSHAEEFPIGDGGDGFAGEQQLLVVVVAV